MENKYYTPKIEEFFEGFCFEQLIGISTNSNELWVKSVFSLEDNTKTPIQNLLNENKIRVKHLNRKDIESEGWEYNLESSKKLNEKNSNYMSIYTSKFKDRESNFYSLFHNAKNNWVLIWTSAGDLSHIISDDNMQVAGSTVFAGFVLNKSRLKLVMEMLNVEKK